jgi:hypothetical protein
MLVSEAAWETHFSAKVDAARLWKLYSPAHASLLRLSASFSFHLGIQPRRIRHFANFHEIIERPVDMERHRETYFLISRLLWTTQIESCLLEYYRPLICGEMSALVV